MQVEYVSIGLKAAAVVCDEAGQEVHRHQVEVQIQSRKQAQLQRPFEHQHQAIFLRPADPIAAVEADVSGTMDIHPGTLAYCSSQMLLGDPLGEVVTILDIQRQRGCGRCFQDISLRVDTAGSRQRRDKIQDFLAAGLAQTQAFEYGLDVVLGQ